MASTQPTGKSEPLERMQARLRAVFETTRAFAEATTDYWRLMEVVAESLTAVIADASAVFILSSDGQLLQRAASHAVDAGVMADFREVHAAHPVVLAQQAAARRVVETGEPILMPHFTASATSEERTTEYSEFHRRIGTHSQLMVALRVQAQSLGMLTLVRYKPSSPAFDSYDLELAQVLADHAALAIMNARSYAAAAAARSDAERAVEALRDSEAAYRLLFEDGPVPALVFEPITLQVLHANDAASTLYGYTRSELLQLRVSDLRAPEERDALLAMLDQAGSSDTSGMARHLRKDGTSIYVEGNSHLSSFRGRPARVVVLKDISERLRAEQELHATEQRLQSTLDHMLEGYVILGHDLRCLYVNNAAAAQARSTRESLIGRTPSELFPGFERSKIFWAIQRCLREQCVIFVESEIRLPGNVGAWFEFTAQPVPEGVLLLTSDVTERKHTQEQLRQAQKMEAIGRLAGGISHDFNNMLSIILSYASLMMAQLQPDEPLWNDANEVATAARRASELTRQLLMFSRQQVLEPKIIDLNEVVSSMDGMLHRVLGEDVRLEACLAPRLGRVRADRSGLDQVILNLVVNARDAMPEGGRLSIETANVMLDEAFVSDHLGARPGPHVMLAVSDTGVGMDAATSARIFEPFFTTKGLGKGTGIGLSTVFGIVQQSGGTIWVHSEPNKGASFKVYLPCADEPVASTAASEPASSTRGHETILVVEDESQVRKVVCTVLKRAGYQVFEAEHGVDALEVAAQLPDAIHLLLTDVVMPQMSGPELARRLGPKRPDMRILCMSGYTDDSIVRHGVLTAELAFLQKPITPNALLSKVREVLDAPAAVAQQPST